MKCPNFDNYFKELELIVKETNLKDYILFGSSVLAIKGLRDVQDLDVAITLKDLSTLSKKYDTKASVNTDAEIKIGNVSFVVYQALSIDKDALFVKHQKYKGVPVISYQTWVFMKTTLDPNKSKDREYLQNPLSRW